LRSQRTHILRASCVPEELAREKIDALLQQCGWIIQITSSSIYRPGVDCDREVPLKKGRCDYLLLIGLAVRLTEDPREAVALTRAAFSSAQKQLGRLQNRTAIAVALFTSVLRAGLAYA
jgi:hypothetical protein